MKRIKVILFLVCLGLLSACGKEKSTLDKPIEDCAFYLDGQEYSVPMKAEEFEDNGWTYVSGASDTVTGESDSETQQFTKGDQQIDVRFHNYSKDVQNVRDCPITRVTFSASHLDKDKLDMGRNITFGASFSEVTKAFGEEKSNESNRAVYYGDYDNWNVCFTSFKKGQVDYIYVENFRGGEKMMKESNNNTAVDDFQGYDKPKELSSDILDFTFMMDGEIYQMPTKVSHFIDDGWSVSEHSHSTIPGKKTETGIFIKKDDLSIQLTVYNPSDKELPVADCLLTEIMVSAGDYEPSFELYANIKVGSSVEDLVSTFGEPLEKETQSTGAIVYVYAHPNTDENTVGHSGYVRFELTEDNKKIDTVHMNHRKQN